VSGISKVCSVASTVILLCSCCVHVTHDDGDAVAVGVDQGMDL